MTCFSDSRPLLQAPGFISSAAAMTQPTALSCAPSVALHRNFWTDSNPQPTAGHSLSLRATYKGVTKVLSPASLGSLWNTLFTASECVCSGPLPSPASVLTSTQNFWRRISSICDRTPNKEIPRKIGRYKAKMGPYQKMTGNHWMGHGF